MLLEHLRHRRAGLHWETWLIARTNRVETFCLHTNPSLDPISVLCSTPRLARQRTEVSPPEIRLCNPQRCP